MGLSVVNQRATREVPFRELIRQLLRECPQAGITACLMGTTILVMLCLFTDYVGAPSVLSLCLVLWLGLAAWTRWKWVCARRWQIATCVAFALLLGGAAYSVSYNVQLQHVLSENAQLRRKALELEDAAAKATRKTLQIQTNRNESLKTAFDVALQKVSAIGDNSRTQCDKLVAVETRSVYNQVCQFGNKTDMWVKACEWLTDDANPDSLPKMAVRSGNREQSVKTFQLAFVGLMHEVFEEYLKPQIAKVGLFVKKAVGVALSANDTCGGVCVLHKNLEPSKLIDDDKYREASNARELRDSVSRVDNLAFVGTKVLATAVVAYTFMPAAAPSVVVQAAGGAQVDPNMAMFLSFMGQLNANQAATVNSYHRVLLPVVAFAAAWYWPSLLDSSNGGLAILWNPGVYLPESIRGSTKSAEALNDESAKKTAAFLQQYVAKDKDLQKLTKWLKKTVQVVRQIDDKTWLKDLLNDVPKDVIETDNVRQALDQGVHDATEETGMALKNVRDVSSTSLATKQLAMSTQTTVVTRFHAKWKHILPLFHANWLSDLDDTVSKLIALCRGSFAQDLMLSDTLMPRSQMVGLNEEEHNTLVYILQFARANIKELKDFRREHLEEFKSSLAFALQTRLIFPEDFARQCDENPKCDAVKYLLQHTTTEEVGHWIGVDYNCAMESYEANVLGKAPRDCNLSNLGTHLYQVSAHLTENGHQASRQHALPSQAQVSLSTSS